MLLTEKSREEEKLSFKEQILRDLERVKEQDRREKEVEIPNLTASSSQASSATPSDLEPETSTEELMADSLSVVDKILKMHQVFLHFQVLELMKRMTKKRKRLDSQSSTRLKL